MAPTVDIRATGIKDALRELNSIDKRLRRQITKDYQAIVAPVVNDAKQHTPDTAPLSGWDRNWTPTGSNSPVLPFQGNTTGQAPRKPTKREMNYPSGRRQYREWAKWDAGIKAYISGKRPTTFGGYTRNLAAFGVRWQGRAAVLFDTSGQARTQQGARMVAALNAKFGAPSRVMWRAYERSDSQVQYELRKLVNKVMQAVGRKI